MTSNGLAAEKPVDDKKLGRVINKQTIPLCTSNRLMSRCILKKAYKFEKHAKNSNKRFSQHRPFDPSR